MSYLDYKYPTIAALWGEDLFNEAMQQASLVFGQPSHEDLNSVAIGLLLNKIKNKVQIEKEEG